MDLVIYSVHPVSIIAICIMVGSLIVAYFKKWMMTYALLVANFIVFILTLIFFENVVGDLGFKPIYLKLQFIPQIYTIFTSMFIHGGFAHIFGNMFIFFFIGMAFEQRIGRKKFILIYLLSGVCATLTHSVLNLGSGIPLIGASGAIFGIMGAFAYSYPRDKIVMPIPLIIMFIARVKVMYAVLLFAAIETAITWWETQTGHLSSTAHFAHIGGLIGGFLLAAVFLRGRRTHTKKGQTVYYDPYYESQIKDINFSNLEKLATTPQLKEILDKVKNETVSQVQNIWLNHFIEKAKCPKCGKDLKQSNRDIKCNNCDFKTKY